MTYQSSSPSKFTFVVLGRSGSGKGTQAEFMLKRLGDHTYHMETGRFLRTILKKINPTTLIARDLMEKGKLMPSWFGAFAWLRELIEKGKADNHLVFDGAPRKIEEAKLIDQVMAWHGRHPPLCIYVDVSEEEATRRLLGRGRDDDHKTAIKNRMEFFLNDVVPVVRYYQRHHRLIRVNGDQPVEQVWQEINQKLSRRLTTLWPLR